MLVPGQLEHSPQSLHWLSLLHTNATCRAAHAWCVIQMPRAVGSAYLPPSLGAAARPPAQVGSSPVSCFLLFHAEQAFGLPTQGIGGIKYRLGALCAGICSQPIQAPAPGLHTVAGPPDYHPGRALVVSELPTAAQPCDNTPFRMPPMCMSQCLIE